MSDQKTEYAVGDFRVRHFPREVCGGVTVSEHHSIERKTWEGWKPVDIAVSEAEALEKLERRRSAVLFFQHNPAWAAEYEAEETAAHNACHDWCVKHREQHAGSFDAPAEMVGRLNAAQAALVNHRKAEQDRWWAAGGPPIDGSILRDEE